MNGRIEWVDEGIESGVRGMAVNGVRWSLYSSFYCNAVKVGQQASPSSSSLEMVEHSKVVSGIGRFAITLRRVIRNGSLHWIIMEERNLSIFSDEEM
jgi:hypothetical protein